jgi:hypothetical protein
MVTFNRENLKEVVNMRKSLVSMVMVVVIMLTVVGSAFAAASPASTTMTPKSTEVMLVMTSNMTAATLIYKANFVIIKGTTLTVSTSDWGLRTLNTSQAYILTLPRTSVPGDLTNINYTYNFITKKFTAVPKVTSKK